MNSRKLASATCTSALLGVLCAAPASALLITFGQLNEDGNGAIGNAAFATDGSGLTSKLLWDPSHMTAEAGFFVETFDLSTKAPVANLPAVENLTLEGDGTLGTTTTVSGTNSDGTPYSAQILSEGCSVNAFGGPIISSTGGGFAVQKGSTSGVAATPAGNDTCFGFGPQPNSNDTAATVKIDYGNILAGGDTINYLGLYYGSIDTYNELRFYAGETLLRTLTGTELLDVFQGTSGNQTSNNSNLYVNLDFAPNEAFTAFEMVTTKRAIEVDNITVGMSSRPVPAPATLALFGVGLAAFATSMRRRRVMAR